MVFAFSEIEIEKFVGRKFVRNANWKSFSLDSAFDVARAGRKYEAVNSKVSNFPILANVDDDDISLAFREKWRFFF